MDIIEYKTSMGTIEMPEETIAKLKGLSIDEQIKFFEIDVYEENESFSYGESDGKSTNSYTTEVEKCRKIEGLIVKDGIIVGAIFCAYNGKPVERLLDEWCLTYYCSDDDGTGSTDSSVQRRIVLKK